MVQQTGRQEASKNTQMDVSDQLQAQSATIRGLQQQINALRTGIPRIGELMSLTPNGTIGTLRVWNHYGTTEIDAVSIAPGGESSTPIQRVFEGVSSEIVTAYMVAGTWGATAVDYTRPTVRREEDPDAIVDAATGEDLDEIGLIYGVPRNGRSDTAYRAALHGVNLHDDTHEYTQGEICLVVSVPPYNIAIPGVMMTHEGTTPLASLAGATPFALTPVGRGFGSIRLAHNGGVVLGTTSGKPTAVHVREGGIDAVVNNAPSIVPLPALSRTDDDGNLIRLTGTDAANKHDAIDIPTGKWDGTYGGIVGGVLQFFGEADKALLQLATQNFQDGRILSWKYAALDSDGIIGARQDGNDLGNSQQADERNLEIPADFLSANPNVIVFLELFALSNTVTLTKRGGTAEVLRGSTFEITSAGLPATLRVSGISGGYIDYTVVEH